MDLIELSRIEGGILVIRIAIKKPPTFGGF